MNIVLIFADILILSSAMGKEHPVRRTLQEFSEISTVHGLGYIFSTSLPIADRLLWALLVLVSLALASYWSVASYNTWQEELTITTLKDAAMPVERISFPAVTICGSGLNMNAVNNALLAYFAAWMVEEGRRSMNKEEDKENWEEFMNDKFAIKDVKSKNIFDILKAFQSPNPDQTMKSLLQMKSVITCAKEGQGPIVHRRKRSTSDNQSQSSLPYWDENGNLYTRMAVPDGFPMGRDIVKDTCTKDNLLPLCRSMQEKQCKKGRLPGSQRDLAVRLATIFCGTNHPHLCPQLQDLFFYRNYDLRLKDPNAETAGTSPEDAMFTARGVVGKNGNAIGIYFTSTTSRPYYAACIQESGLAD